LPQGAAALIRKGQRAWKAIKGTAEEQRFWWFDVGLALAEGKALTKAERGGLLFSEWCLEQFPGICMENEVPHAIWMATEFSVSSTEIPPTLSYPQAIRRWFNEQQAKAAPWDTSEPAPEVVEVPAAKKFKTQRDAEKFIKVDQRAESGVRAPGFVGKMSEGIHGCAYLEVPPWPPSLPRKRAGGAPELP